MNEQQQISQMNAQIASQLKHATDAACDKCSCAKFAPVFIIKRLSALVSPTAQEMNIPIQLFQCSECGHVNEEWLPDIDKVAEERTEERVEESQA